MQVYAGFPQLLFTRSLTDEKALGTGAFCEETREKETGVLRAPMPPTYLPLPALLLLRSKLLKGGGGGCGNLRLAAGEAGDTGRGKAPGILCMPARLGLGSVSLPSAPSLCCLPCAD